MYRDLLVHVDGGQAGRRRVQFAVDLAMRVGARLTGLHVTPPVEVPPLYKPSHVAEVAAQLSLKLALNAREAATVFSEETARRLPDACWFEATGDMVQGICERARYADLIILGQYETQGPPEKHPLPLAHSGVLKCGRPILVMPADAPQSALGRIAVAWDGSREAVRSVHDALPLLRLAQSVQIVTISDPSAAEDNALDANNLSTHLARHGVPVGTHVSEIRPSAEHATLSDKIEQGEYDLLVMGGYSHAMWWEFIFGGATQSILLLSKIPVFVSH